MLSPLWTHDFRRSAGDFHPVMDDVPFDLKNLRCIVYEYTPREMATLGAEPEEYDSERAGQAWLESSLVWGSTCV